MEGKQGMRRGRKHLEIPNYRQVCQREIQKVRFGKAVVSTGPSNRQAWGVESMSARNRFGSLLETSSKVHASNGGFRTTRMK